MSYQPKGSMCMSCMYSRKDCSHLDFASMRVIDVTPSASIVRCTEYVSNLEMCLIRSIDRDMYWKSNESGYTSDVMEAGIYSRKDAIRIVEQANITGEHEEMLPLNMRLPT